MNTNSWSQPSVWRPPHATSLESISQPATELKRRSQLSLRALFFCTTYFAVASALAIRWGLGVFVLISGIMLTWLSFRGYLWWVQTNRQRPRLFGISWLLFGVSFLLPTLEIKACRNSPPTIFYGYQVAWMAASTIEEPVATVFEMAKEPRSRTWSRLGDVALEALGCALMNLPNLVILLSPWLLYRLQHGKGGFLAGVLGCAAVVSWMWGADADDFRIGYYVWSAAITTASLGKPPTRGTLVAMTLFGVAMFAWGWSGWT